MSSHRIKQQSQPEEINSTIEKGALSRKNYEISVYCNALSKFPEQVRDAILERDKCHNEYYAYMENHAEKREKYPRGLVNVNSEPTNTV
ncbi:hypothetical protein C4G53_RS24405 [Vibrio parahaemolyticus]|nr:hypothetical protein [Vibrio parahaemolyticus]